MVPKYKLIYFEFTGLGEPIRLLFIYGGIEFEDVRLPQKDWPDFKKTTPLEKLPILEVEGSPLKYHHQSLSLCRFVGKLVGLAGDNYLEALAIDAAAETVCEVRLAIVAYVLEKKEDRKLEMRKEVINNTLPFLLPKLEGWTKSNNGYLANGKLSWADIYFFAVTEYLPDYLGKDFLNGYSNLQALNKTISQIPAIKSWILKRPPNKAIF